MRRRKLNRKVCRNHDDRIPIPLHGPIGSIDWSMDNRAYAFKN
jgi:hypothetical protein